MSGSSKGLAKTFLIGARISTRLDADAKKCVFMDYTPANLRGGDQKKVNARLMIPVMVNLYRKEEGDGYRIIAWGRLADTFALNLNRGKEMHFECEPTKYLTDMRSRVDGAVILDKDGQPLRIRRTSYRIVDFAYGNDGYNTLKEEIQFGIVTGEGKRPENWNVPGHPDHEIWTQMLAARRNTYFSPEHQAKGFFGFARVVMPRTPGYQILYGAQYDEQAVIYNGPQSTAPQTQTAGLVNQVQNTLNTNQQASSGPVMQNNVGAGPVTQQPVMQQPVQQPVQQPIQNPVQQPVQNPGQCPF